MSRINNQLPQVAFSILLALSLKPRHGYEIMQQVELDSNGKINLGPGALYTSIKHLRAEDLIEEIDNTEDKKRRYYRLTNKGFRALQEETEYYATAVNLARDRQIL